MADTTTTTEWVCTDCYLALAGYDAAETGRPMPTPYPDTDVVLGTPIEDCDTPECVSAVANRDESYDLHTECDHDSFSLHTCDGCGSTLAGDRYAVTTERTNA